MGNCCPICQPGQIAGFDAEMQCRVSLRVFTTGFRSQITGITMAGLVNWMPLLNGFSSMSSGTSEHVSAPRLGGPYAWLVWSLAAIAFGYAFFHRVTPSVMVSDLMTEFAIGGAMLGTLSALYFYPYVLLQVPLGGMLEVFGTRRLLSVALLLAGIGSFLFGTAHSLEVAYLGRILIGIGSSVGFLGSLALASKWFPANRFAFLAGLAMFIAMASGMAAQAPLAFFIDLYGWRSSLLALGIFGFVLAALVFLFVRNAPAESAVPPDAAAHAVSPSASARWSDLFASLRLAMVSADVWKMAIVAATMAGPMLALGGLWGTPYLMVAYDLTRTEAALYMSLLLLGWAISSPTSGWLSDRIGQRKLILVWGSGLMSVMMTTIIFVPQLPFAVTVICLVMMGLSGGVMPASFALVRDVMPTRLVGATTGIVNSMTVASGAILQPLVGLALDLSWDGTIMDGARHYAAADYRMAFLLVLASLVIGLLTAFSLRETPLEDGTL